MIASSNDDLLESLEAFEVPNTGCGIECLLLFAGVRSALNVSDFVRQIS